MPLRLGRCPGLPLEGIYYPRSNPNCFPSETTASRGVLPEVSSVDQVGRSDSGDSPRSFSPKRRNRGERSRRDECLPGVSRSRDVVTMRWNPFRAPWRSRASRKVRRKILRHYATLLNQAAFDLSGVVVDSTSLKKIGNIPGMLTGIADFLDDLGRQR